MFSRCCLLYGHFIFSEGPLSPSLLLLSQNGNTQIYPVAMLYTSSIPVGKVAEGGTFSLFTRSDVFCGYGARAVD